MGKSKAATYSKLQCLTPVTAKDSHALEKSERHRRGSLQLRQAVVITTAHHEERDFSMPLRREISGLVGTLTALVILRAHHLPKKCATIEGALGISRQHAELRWPHYLHLNSAPAVSGLRLNVPYPFAAEKLHLHYQLNVRFTENAP